jgi:Na+/H+-translocating membrane pyrophosphatase
MVVLVFIAVLLALLLAAFNFNQVKKLDEGTELMKEIATAIQ